MNNAMNQPTWEHDDLVHGYWVIPGRLLATEYPGHKNAEQARRKLAVLTQAGVSSFVDLTEPGETTRDGSPMVPYEALLGGLAPSEALLGGLAPSGALLGGLNYRRLAIPDQGVIADDGYDEILGHIRAELDAGRVVLVHCWGGKGRTGTVVGSWLIDTEGRGYPEVIDRMQELRAGSRKAGHPVPDTEEQCRVLRRRAWRRVA